MKQKKTIKIILIIVLALIIVAGIVTFITVGPNYDIVYTDTCKIEIDVGKTIDVNEIKTITDEVLPGQEVLIQTVEVYDDAVAITTRGMTEEQKNSIVNKINEKYGTEIKTEDVMILIVPRIKIMDMAQRYIVPVIVASAVIIVYLIIRYRKLGVGKVILKTIGILILAQAELASIIVIARIPVGRLTIPLVLTVYMLSLMGITTSYERKLQTLKEEEKDKKGK